MKTETLKGWAIVACLAGLALVIWCEALFRVQSIFGG
jgi:hypothetical protein